MNALRADVRALLACPRCHGELIDEPHSLRCDACLLRYPVRDGIPVLLIDEAERLAGSGDH